MPEVLFTVLLPDGQERQCYSPSTVVREYFQTGEEMPVAEFRTRSREALAAAGERVRAKYGFSCSSAASQVTEIEAWAQAYAPEAIMKIIRI